MATGITWESADPSAARARLAALGVPDLSIAFVAGGPAGDRLVVEPDDLRGHVDGSLAAIGWATVEIERAAGQVGGEFAPAEPDGLLGAFAALRERVVLLEPSTEGRLAATLARHGEGPAAIYLRAPERDLRHAVARASRHGLRFSRPAPGPLGRSVLLLGGPIWGPHVLLLGSATIER